MRGVESRTVGGATGDGVSGGGRRAGRAGGEGGSVSRRPLILINCLETKLRLPPYRKRRMDIWMCPLVPKKQPGKQALHLPPSIGKPPAGM